MGLYDDLRVKYPLPRPEMQERTFQTKSLACELTWYLITEDGRLLHRGEEPIPFRGAVEFYDWERVPYQNEDPLPNPLVHFSALFDGGKLINIIETGKESWERDFVAWTNSHRQDHPVLPKEAFERDSVYGEE